VDGVAGQSGVYRGVSAQDRAAHRRARLLEATLAVWAADDTRITMTAVCAEAGLTERYFYESFTGLDAALTAVMDEVAQEIEQRTQAAADVAAAAGGNAAARVRASLLAFVELLVEDPRKGRVAIIQAGAMPGLRGRRTQLLRHFAHRTAQETAQLGAPDSTGPADREIAGLMFVGGMAELVTAWLDGALDASPEQIVAAGSRMLLG